MATIKVTCPKCSKPFGVLDRQMGTSVHCPHCRQRMTIGQRKAAAPRNPQEEAAAQLLGTTPQPSAGQGAASSGGTGSAASDALEAAFGPPRAPKPAPKPVMAAPAPQPYQTRLAQNLGLNEDETLYEDHMLDNAPVRNRTVLWVWGSILGVLVIFLVIGIVIMYKKFNSYDRAGAFASQTMQADRSRGGGPTKTVYVNKQVDAQGNVVAENVETNVDLGGKERVHPDEAFDSAVSTLVPHFLSGNLSDYSITKDNQQYEVWVGYVENTGAETVRRATWALQLVGATEAERTGTESPRVFGQGSYWFNDVRPGEKVYFILESLYDAAPQRMMTLPDVPELSDTTMPVFEFDVKPLSIKREGKTAGTVSFDITNLSKETARSVDVTFLLYGRDDEPAGWATVRMTNLTPQRPQRGEAKWTNGRVFPGVDHVGPCRAQVVEEGTAQVQ